MRLLRVHLRLVSNPLDDCVGEVHRQLDTLSLDVPQGPMAITAGSRGISNIAAITQAVGDWLRQHGATPFIVPCMGSHNGATAAGQQQMVESLGITEAAMGMPIRSSMECVKVGTVSSGDWCSVSSRDWLTVDWPGTWEGSCGLQPTYSKEASPQRRCQEALKSCGGRSGY